MGWLTPPIYKPGDADAVLAAQISRGRQVEPSLQSLVYQQQIAQDVTYNNNPSFSDRSSSCTQRLAPVTPRRK